MHRHSVGRGRGALTARGTRRKYVLVGSVAASMPPHGPASGEDTAPESEPVTLLKACLLISLRCEADRTRSYLDSACHALLATMHTDHLDWPLPAHRRGTLRGMDAA
ncbi:hypothetical protein E1J24_03590 [Xanthomonas hortorum pv. pelargonii]|uniref:Uncharacterized protein n=1 Tax=Xanthomonas hortorum pv. pelargonii TaxID=453602 RepID=A0AAW9ZMR3_9XANT|nr:hypothetical protein [Xanthomonas hortorum pv. pelargonii]